MSDNMLYSCMDWFLLKNWIRFHCFEWELLLLAEGLYGMTSIQKMELTLFHISSLKK